VFTALVVTDIAGISQRRDPLPPLMRSFRFALCLSMCLGITACDELTRVTNTTVVQPTDLANPAGAIQLRNQAVATFAGAYAAQAFYSGLIADEFTDPTGSNPADRRVVDPTKQSSGSTYPYDQVSQAHLQALDAIAELRQYDPTLTTRVGELYALLGYDEVFLAEDMCSGVPFGVIQNGTYAQGPVLARGAMLSAALAHFDTAKASAAGNDSLSYLIAVGRARVLLDSNDAAAAASQAQGIPSGFAYAFEYSLALPPINALAVDIGTSGLGSVADLEGQNGLNFISAHDPRVATDTVETSIGIAVTGLVNLTSTSAPMTLASGVEAQLIVAEAKLRVGDVGWALILNGLRQAAITPAMDTLPTDSTTGASPAMQVDVFFRERAFWLFATGHRQGDLRRLVRQYQRGVETVFPTGLYRGGPQTYGTDVTYVPFGEQYNTGYHGCINRSP